MKFKISEINTGILVSVLLHGFVIGTIILGSFFAVTKKSEEAVSVEIISQEPDELVENIGLELEDATEISENVDAATEVKEDVKDEKLAEAEPDQISYSSQDLPGWNDALNDPLVLSDAVNSEPMPTNASAFPVFIDEIYIKKPERSKVTSNTKKPNVKPVKKARTQNPRTPKGASQGVANVTKPKTTGASRTVMRAYAAKVQAKINRTRLRNVLQNGRAVSGKAIVAFRINRSGGLQSIAIVKGSGKPAIDKAAIAHIKRSAPFPKPPKGFNQRLKIPISVAKK